MRLRSTRPSSAIHHTGRRPRAVRTAATALAAFLVASLLTATPASADPYGGLDPEDLPPAGQLIRDPAPLTGDRSPLREPGAVTTSSTAPAQRYNGEISGVMGAWGGYSNGTIPVEELCTFSFAASHHRARCDAAAALEEMNAAYRARFGSHMSITSTYRTYEQQVELRARLGRQAAVPGTSNHGWGLAIDFGGGINTFGSEQHNWMRANANRFGWYHPAWAQINGSLPEAWHWEYAGAVASNLAGHNRALAMELTRTEPWNNATQRQCLDNLWTQFSRWNHGADHGSNRRGIPRTDMVAAYGSGWATSQDGQAFLRVPQRQIERGLTDLTRAHGSACAAWEHWGPRLGVSLAGPATVRPGGSTTLDITFDRDRARVASETVHLQAQRPGGGWDDVQPVAVTAGTARTTIRMGSDTRWFRVRTQDSLGVSASFRVDIAAVDVMLTGPSTVPAGGRTTVEVAYLKDAKPVPAATVHLQAQRNGTWVDVSEAEVVSGVARVTVRPGSTSTTYRVRNWNTSAVSSPFTVAVAEVRADVPEKVTVPAAGERQIRVEYLKDARPVPSAALTLQELRGDAWVDRVQVQVTDGVVLHAFRAGYEDGTFRYRNFDGSAVSHAFRVEVTAPEFRDVPRNHPFVGSINWIVLSGIATGYTDGTYRPNSGVSRQAMAAFLYRMAGSPDHTPPAASPFADLRPTDPFYAEITWLAGEGITTGTTLADGRVVFRPSSAVSREAMAAFLHRYSGSPEVQAPEVSPFADMRPGQTFYEEVSWLAAEGISTGTALADGTVEYRPSRPVSRQAMAAFLQRMVDGPTD